MREGEGVGGDQDGRGASTQAGCTEKEEPVGGLLGLLLSRFHAFRCHQHQDTDLNGGGGEEEEGEGRMVAGDGGGALRTTPRSERLIKRRASVNRSEDKQRNVRAERNQRLCEGEKNPTLPGLPGPPGHGG